jgi:hypothetical protein
MTSVKLSSCKMKSVAYSTPFTDTLNVDTVELRLSLHSYQHTRPTFHYCQPTSITTFCCWHAKCGTYLWLLSTDVFSKLRILRLLYTINSYHIHTSTYITLHIPINSLTCLLTLKWKTEDSKLSFILLNMCFPNASYSQGYIVKDLFQLSGARFEISGCVTELCQVKTLRYKRRKQILKKKLYNMALINAIFQKSQCGYLKGGEGQVGQNL